MTEQDAFNAFEDQMPGTAGRTRAESRVEDLRSRGGVFVEAVRATRMAMVLTDPALPGNPIVFANESFFDLSGYDINEVLGQQPYFMNGPDTDDADATRFGAALAEDHDETLQTIQYRKDGARLVCSLFLTALKDQDGRTLHHLLSWRDITGQVDAETEVGSLRAAQARLRRSEERYRAFVTASADAVYRMSPDWSQMWQLDGQGFIGDTLEPSDNWMDNYILPEDRDRVQEAIDLAIRTRSQFDVEHRVIRADGTPGWIKSRATPMLGENGEITEWIGTASDVTQAKAGQEALRVSEERFRLIFENARDYAIFTTDLDGRVTDWHDGAEAVFGYSRAEAVGMDASILFTPEDRGQGVPECEIRTADEQGRAPDARWHMCKDGSRVFINGVVTRIDEGAASGFLKIGQDVTERRRSGEHQRLLLAELQHRVRNILAMIQSVVRRTVDTSESPEEYARHLGGRIAAMARTQAMLTRSPTRRIDLEEVLRDELLSVAASEKQHWCEGPQVLLPPKAAEVFTLAIHELATNSVKYGALSGPSGQLEIRWDLELRQEQQWLVFEWEETRVQHGGFSRQGFGTELITRRVPYELRGKGDLKPTDGGMVATLEFPLLTSNSILETLIPEQLN